MRRQSLGTRRVGHLCSHRCGEASRRLRCVATASGTVLANFLVGRKLGGLLPSFRFARTHTTLCAAAPVRRRVVRSLSHWALDR